MKRLTYMLVLLTFFSFALGLILAPSVMASESEPSYRGTEPVEALKEPIALFDDSETFVPPEELPIVDVYEKDMLAMTEAELAEDLETVSVTPEGQVELLSVSEEDVRMFMEEIKIDYEGEEEEDMGASDFSDDEPPAESVIGRDTRTRITATSRYPFRTMGRIDLGCTGTLIGPRHVLTAGHCVYNIRNDRWYSNLDFSPGQNGSSRPYGKIGWKRAISVKGWTEKHKRNYDYAMIVLKEDIGNRIGWMGYGWKKPLPKYNVNINGYPADKSFGTMWHAFCKLRIIRTRRLYYACDTFGGMSGSAVYVYFKSNSKRTIYGIHAYGVDSTSYNGATRITKSVFSNLKRWKSTY